MEHVVNIEYLDRLDLLGITGRPPEEMRARSGAVPQPGDVIGFPALRFRDGRAVALEVTRRFFSVDERGDTTHIHITLTVIADPSFAAV